VQKLTTSYFRKSWIVHITFYSRFYFSCVAEIHRPQQLPERVLSSNRLQFHSSFAYFSWYVLSDFLGRPERWVPDGLMFYCWCIFFFFFLFRHSFSELDPSTDRPETLPHGWNLAEFYNPTPKIRGPPPKKFVGQKHAKFRSILDHFRLWSRIFPEQLKISEIGRRYKLWQFLLRLTKKVR